MVLNQINKQCFIFDLDGTLIDSAESILTALKFSLKVHGIFITEKFTAELIGPPINEIICSLLGPSAPDKLVKDISETFKIRYDESAYKLTQLYKGVDNLLRDLHICRKKLYLATNKRLVPTKKILTLFNWNGLFAAVYTPDRQFPAFKSKSDMLSVLLKDMSINPLDSIYIGDRIDDFDAARNNNLDFIHAGWGYEAMSTHLDCTSIEEPNGLRKLIISGS